MILLVVSMQFHPESSIQTAEAQPDPFYARGGLAEINASIIVYPSVAQFQLKLMYFGDAGSLVSDEMLFSSNFELLAINSSVPTIQVVSEIKSNGSSTSIVFNFSRPLLSGEFMTLTIKGRFIFTNSIPDIDEKIWWNYTRNVGFQTVKVLVFDGIDIRNVEPTASITRSEGSFIAMLWNDIVPSGFYLHFSAHVTEIARNELFFAPSILTASIGTKESILSIQIGNVGLDSVFVWIETPNFVSPEVYELTIESFTLRKVRLEIHLDEDGVYKGSIIVRTNRTQTPLTIPIELSADVPEKNIVQTILFSSIVFLSVLGIGGFFYRKSHLSEQKSSKSHLSEKKPLEAHAFHLNNLDERQIAIIEFIQANPGCSQQAIANHLGISKATASREITRLENLGYLKKEKEGMSHRIYLHL